MLKYTFDGLCNLSQFIKVNEFERSMNSTVYTSVTKINTAA